MKRLTPIIVRWYDAQGYHGWLTPEELDQKVALKDKDIMCETRGFCYAQDKYALTVVCTRALDDTQHSETVRIPRKAIINILIDKGG